MKRASHINENRKHLMSTMLLVLGVFFVSLFHIPVSASVVSSHGDDQEQPSSQEILIVAPATIAATQSTFDVQLFVIETILMVVEDHEDFPAISSEVLKQMAHARVLFRLIISPNAP